MSPINGIFELQKFPRKKLPKTGTLILKLDASDSPGKDYAEIQSSVESLEGVTSAEVNYLTGVIKVEYDPEKVTAEEIRGMVEASRKLDP